MKYSADAECEIIHFVNCEISHFVRCEMKFAHIRVSEYFTFAEQIFHSGAISLARKGKFRWKKHLLTQVLFSGGGRWIRTTEVSDNRFTVCPLWPLGNSPIFNCCGKTRWSWWTDLNPRPADYKSAALPAELHQRISHDAYYYTISFSPCQYLFYSPLPKKGLFLQPLVIFIRTK